MSPAAKRRCEHERPKRTASSATWRGSQRFVLWVGPIWLTIFYWTLSLAYIWPPWREWFNDWMLRYYLFGWNHKRMCCEIQAFGQSSLVMDAFFWFRPSANGTGSQQCSSFERNKNTRKREIKERQIILNYRESSSQGKGEKWCTSS